MSIKHKFRFLIFLTAYLIFLAVDIFLWMPTPPASFTVSYDLSCDSNDKFQIYYSDGYIWNETASLFFDYNEPGKESSVYFDIPYNMTKVRIDLGNASNTVKIKNLKVSLYNNNITISPENILAGEENNIPGYRVESGTIIVSTDNDSYFSYELSSERKAFENILKERTAFLKIVFAVIGIIATANLYRKSDGAAEVIKSIIKNRRLILNLSVADFKSKYAGSQFGIIWAFVQPAVTSLIYIFVFQVIGRAAPLENNYPYSLWLLPGIIPWFYFAESVMSSTGSLLEYSYLVKKVMFNIEILPVVKIMSCFFVHVFLSFFILVVYFIAGVPLKLTMIQIFYYMLCNTAISMALSYLTCSLLPFFKDIGQIVNLILMVAMWACPIMWDINIIPEELSFIKTAVDFNPMYYIVRGFRESYMGEAWFTAHPIQTVYFWTIVLLLFILNTKLFRKLQPHFSDVL